MTLISMEKTVIHYVIQGIVARIDYLIPEKKTSTSPENERDPAKYNWRDPQIEEDDASGYLGSGKDIKHTAEEGKKEAT